MTQLFKRPNGSPIQFHLADLPETLYEKYKQLIETNGGKIEKEPHETVLSFTVPTNCYQFKFVFNVKFIDDCVEQMQILNTNNYYIGDSRISPECKWSKLVGGNGTCLWYLYGTENLCEKLQNAKGNSFLQRALDNSNQKGVPNEREDNYKQINEDFFKTEATSGSDTCPLGSEYSDSEDDKSFSKKNYSKKSTDVKEKFDTRFQKLSIKKVTSKSLKSQPSTSKSHPVELESEEELEEIEVINSIEELTQWAEKIRKDKEIDEFGFPKSEGVIAQQWEIKTMLDFLIKTGNIYESKAPTTWILARNLKIFPKKRNEESLKSIFVETILPNIEKYDLPKDILKKFVNFRTFGRFLLKEPNLKKLMVWAEKVTQHMEKDEAGYPIGNEMEFEDWERKMIIDFIVERGNFNIINESSMWQLACDLKIFPIHRTKERINYEFRFNVLHKIESFHLPQKIEKMFIRKRNLKRFIKPTEELEKWAEEITQEREKDILGFPITLKPKQFEQWEIQTMINFLVKTKNIKYAVSPSTWFLAANLKIFPLHRTGMSLMTFFRNCVLPIIESFNLPANIEAEFIKLRASHVSILEPTEDMKEWAEEISRDRPKDNFGFPIEDNYKIQTWEKKLMIEFLIKWDKIEKAKSRGTWRQVSKLKILPKIRTEHILWQEFCNNILTSIEEFNLPKEIEAQFITLKTSGSLRRKINEPSMELKQWAKQITKNIPKDKFGYPKQNCVINKNWEKRTMIDFLIKSKEIDKLPVPSVWIPAVALKILPKSRSAESLNSAFHTTILPKIEQFNLPKDIKVKFLRMKESKH